MHKVWTFLQSKQLFLAIMLLVFISACSTQAPTTPPPTVSQQLRITNSSNVDFTELVVLFPGPAWDSESSRIEFGNIPAGQTTEYVNVPNGVYRYAAYEYTLNGNTVRQPVIDWVGESPMTGKSFTYQLMLDLNKVEGDQITLVSVMVDEP